LKGFAMTIEIKIKCDAFRCHNSKEITDYTDTDVEHAGFHSDPRNEGYHYCEKCWPTVQKEIEDE
jgi:hypothetical protein